MPNKFQTIMQHLNPKVIIAKCEVTHDTARAKYQLQSSVVKKYIDFENAVISYVAFHMTEVFTNHPPFEHCLEIARKFLDASVGFDNSVFAAMSGTNSGLPGVLNQIAEGFKKEAKQAYFRYIVDTFIDPLSFPEVVEVMRELKAKLGAHSPQPFQFIEPEAMAGHYKDYLWSYIENLTQYKNLWAY